MPSRLSGPPECFASSPRLGIKEPIFNRPPQHPGAAHYLIHLYDNPPIAERMEGCRRAYGISDPVRGGRSVLSAAFNNDCDAIVATFVLGRDRRAETEPQVIGFLNGPAVLQ